ncbi:pleckstrin homology domain-containing family O member 2 [Scophthalmus maximus]|uniref:pleckstrin homology domain-containing family O member 2 n=1 Tax=Scophthalmus maximus TaxID=52904 RepID=UPI001FA867F6|nr:pleckstrin homology domain-containing family O member 2 [Scophthalmus maximus]
MEDGVKEDPTQCKEPKFLGKAGWVKKAPGRILASYKDRFIHVEKTEIVVYENEELQNCLERLDLENYDRCHELKSPFKKKHRLILIRSTKSGNKVNDVKFQTQTADEKGAWIKALTDGINRAKNKVFDEVTVDDSSNLEHVTRTRPKVNRPRRPPTRIHMKEVAVASSEGILRLDLDLEDAVMCDGAHRADSDGTEQQSGPSAEEVSPQKKVITPPMPPTKEAKPSSAPENEPDKDDGPEKKVLKPPMPPSKEAKLCVSPVEVVTEEAKAEKSEIHGAMRKAGATPSPPIKPVSNITEPTQSSLNPHPPAPPPKEKKPSHPVVEPDQEVEGKAGENQEADGDNREEMTGTAVETEEEDQKALVSIRGEEIPSTEEQVSAKVSGETMSSQEELVRPDMMQRIEDNPAVSQPVVRQDHTASDTTDSSLHADVLHPNSEIPSVDVPLNDQLTDGLNLSPLICHLPAEKRRNAEEKSVDSGQHSDDDSEGSESEDALAASTAALSGSHAGLDVLGGSKDNIPITGQHSHNVQIPVALKLPHSKPSIPLKPSTKVKSASIGDLLAVSSERTSRAVDPRDRSPTDDVVKLEKEVALEMEEADELLSRVSQFQDEGARESTPGNILAEAMEKLRQADHVLREVKKLKLTKTSGNRNSW